MQFDLIHASTIAALWEPYWVLGSVLFAIPPAFLARLISRVPPPRPRRELVPLLLLSLLLTPLGANAVAGLFGGLVTYSGGHSWLAVPIALVLFGSRRLQPKSDPVISFSRALAFLSALYAAWALAVFPSEWLATFQKLPSRQAFYENVAFVPILAIFGAASLFTIHKTVSAGGDPEAPRAWLVARGQLVLATCVLLAQLWFVNQAICPFCRDFPAHILALVLVALIGIEGRRRFR